MWWGWYPFAPFPGPPWFYPWGAPGAPAYPFATPDQELASLRSTAEMLRRELEKIEERIRELEERLRRM